MWEFNYKESGVPKNWCFWTVVLEKTLESPLDCKEVKPIHSKGNQSWIFIGRTDVEAETPILWPPDAKNWLIRKTLMLGKIEGGRRRGRQRIRWLDGIIDSMAWVWASSRSWWWTGKPGVLQSMGSQRVGRDWVTKLNSYYILKIECVSHIDSTYQDHYISRAQATCGGFPAEKGKSRIWKYRQKNCKHLGVESSPNKCLEILLLTNRVFCLLDSLACLHVTIQGIY